MNLLKPEAEPRLPGESSALLDWARRITGPLRLIIDFLAPLASTSTLSLATFSVASSTGDTSIGIDSPVGHASSLYGVRGGLPRWQISLPNGTAETGGNVGSDFTVGRFNDAGTFLDLPFYIIRSTGNATFAKALAVTGTFTGLTSVAAPVIYTHPANGYQYANPSYWPDGGGNYYCMGILGDPNLGSSVYHRIFHSPGVWAGHEFQTQGSSFQLRGSGIAYNSGGWTTFSDRRVKTNLVPIASASAKVATLTGYEYDRVDLKNMDGTPIHQAGLVAQDVQAVLAAAVHQDPPTADTPEPIRSLNYDAVVALLVNAFNEQAARIAALETQIATLKGAA